MQPGRREGEPCSDQDQKAQLQALALALALAQAEAEALCPMRYAVLGSILY